MDAPHPRAGWEGAGGRWFRKTELYTAVFPEDLDLDNYIVAGAPYAGAIALWRDDSKLQTFRADQAKPSIDIYSLAGRKLRSILWDKGAIKGLGWTDEESLIAVTTDGTVRCYDMQGDFNQFSLGNGAEEDGVQSCRFCDQSMVALLSNNTFVAVPSYVEPRPRLLASPPPGEIYSWNVMSPAQTLSRTVEVLLSIGKTVCVIDAAECQDHLLDIGPFSHVTASPDGRLVALYADTGKAHVVTADFQAKVVEYDSGSKIPPCSLAWCGEDALIAWEDEVHVVAPDCSNVSYIYHGGRVHVFTEHDGARLITNDACEFLERVPAATDEVFGHSLESSPASILLDAVRHLEMQSPKADDFIQLIKANMAEAVTSCVNAAGREFVIHWQKQLLKAASFGKSVLDIYNCDEFVEMCECLRVLNAVRFHEVGLPVSYEQFQRMTPERLIRRLLNRHQYLLALRIAGYLKLPTNRIFVHWAAAKVRTGSGSDADVCHKIVSRLSGKPGISFEEIARAAYDEGRPSLATELLNHEPRGGRQVPLLVSMGEDELALDKAIESGDTDLVHWVLLQLKRKLPLAAFLRSVSARPAACALIESAASREGDNELLKDLYYQDDRRLDGACVFLQESLRQPDGRTAADKLALGIKLLGDSRETAGELQAAREASLLLRLHDALARELSDSFAGMSVHETVAKLIRLGYHGRAKKLTSDFKVPDKVAWWIRLRALVEKRDWNELEEISRGKRPPIGWQAFFDLVLQAGNVRLAAAFIPKCAGEAEVGASVGMYEQCGMRIRAAEEAVRLRDATAWTRLLELAGRDTTEGVEIERMGKGVFGKT